MALRPAPEPVPEGRSRGGGIPPPCLFRWGLPRARAGIARKVECYRLELSGPLSPSLCRNWGAKEGAGGDRRCVSAGVPSPRDLSS